MRIEQINLTEHIDEMMELFLMHREELAVLPHLMVFQPRWARYRAMEIAGELFTLALYDGDGKIRGYTVTGVWPNMHYSAMIDAFNDVIFIHPDFRKGKWGLKLIRQTEIEAKRRGAHRIIFHGKIETAFSALMPKLGYTVHDIVFGKEI